MANSKSTEMESGLRVGQIVLMSVMSAYRYLCLIWKQKVKYWKNIVVASDQYNKESWNSAGQIKNVPSM